MNVFPCLTWVRRGVAKSMPEKVQLSKEELKRIIEETKDAINDADEKEWSDTDSEDDSDEDVEGATAAKPKSSKQKLASLGKRKISSEVSPVDGNDKNDDNADDDDDDDIEKKYGLDDYDDNDTESVNPLHGIGKLSFYSSNDDDPYITLKDDDSDAEDFEIKPTDNLLVAGRAQEDACLLEVYVYNESSGSFYIHHDLVLPSFPLSVEWLNYDTGEEKPGNFAAIGTMLPQIDIWDLDLVDSLEPVVTLQGNVKKKSTKKKGSSSGHTDAVLDLSWNSILRNVLASASADCSVGVWDLSQGKIATSLRQHEDKVQCVKWHPFEAQSLLSGSFDHTVKVYDCRTPDAANKSWNLQGEIERLTWNHFSPFYFLASTDKGMVYYLDVRSDKPVFTLSAHSEAVSGLVMSSGTNDMLVTTSADHTMKVWDIADNKPSMILEKDLKMSELHCVGCCPEAPTVFAFGGSNQIKVWDIRESAAVKRHFEERSTGGNITEKGDNSNMTDSEAVNALGTLQLGCLTTDNDELDIETVKSKKRDTGKSRTEKKFKKKKRKGKKPK